MSFATLSFWLFFLIVLGIYRMLPFRAQNRFLLVASQFFYGCWDWRFLVLIWITILSDFFLGRFIQTSEDPRRRKLLVTTSLVVNLGILATFKYANFFVGEAAALLDRLGIENSLPVLGIVLPVGISFYTFQSLSYSIDIYRRRLKPVEDLGDFALYVSFFPQLVAGPIERAASLLPQIDRPRSKLTEAQFRDGIYYLIFGLFMKIVIADNLAPLANYCFGLPSADVNGAEALLGAYAFTFQIYGDFFGYSSIAQGLAMLMGFKLMANFRNPFYASSISEFWQRWHISLSTWLRDYLYFSLGGIRSRWRPYANLIITMGLAGLWHGANWNFLLWGLFFGTCMVVERLAREFFPPKEGARNWKPLKTFVTFHIVVLSMIIFRSQSLEQIGAFFSGLTRWSSTHDADVIINGFSLLALYVGPLMIYEFFQFRKGDIMILTKAPWPVRAVAYSFLALALLFLHAPEAADFIYFQF